MQCSPMGPGLRIALHRHEGVLAALEIGEVFLEPRQVRIAELVQLLLAAAPQREVVMATGRRDAHEGLRHEAGDQVEFARDLRADLAVRGESIGRAQAIVIHPVELELTRRVLVIALDHVETHGARVLDRTHEHGTQRLELVDVIAVGLGESPVRQAVCALFEPHHLGLAAVAKVQSLVGLLEGLMNDPQVAAAVGGQMPARVLLLLAVAETGAENPSDPLVPRQLHEGLGVGNADQLGGLRPVADIILVPIDIQIGGGPIDELEALLSDALPMIGRYPLADDTTGHRYELAVEVLDAELVDLLPHLLDEIAPPRGIYMGVQISH